MNNYLKNITYNQILEEAKDFHTTPEGLSFENPTSKSDTILIKQNNIIILLLLKIVQKLDQIQNKPSSSKLQDIDDIIKGISTLFPLFVICIANIFFWHVRVLLLLVLLYFILGSSFNS